MTNVERLEHRIALERDILERKIQRRDRLAERMEKKVQDLAKLKEEEVDLIDSTDKTRAKIDRMERDLESLLP